MRTVFVKSYCFRSGNDSEVRLLVLTIKSFLLISKVIKEKIKLYFFHFSSDSCFGLTFAHSQRISQKIYKIYNYCDNNKFIHYKYITRVDYHIKYRENLLLSHNSYDVYLLLNLITIISLLSTKDFIHSLHLSQFKMQRKYKS